MPRRWLLHSPDPGWPRHHWKGRKRGFRRRGISADCGSGTQGDRINRGVFWHGTNRWTGDKEIKGPELEEYVRHRLSLFEPTGFYLDDVILGPAKQPTEGKVFGNVIEECL
jgi:hypothetical protein